MPGMSKTVDTRASDAKEACLVAFEAALAAARHEAELEERERIAKQIEALAAHQEERHVKGSSVDRRVAVALRHCATVVRQGPHAA